MNQKIILKSLSDIEKEIVALKKSFVSEEALSADADISRLVDYFYMFKTEFEVCVEEELV